MSGILHKKQVCDTNWKISCMLHDLMKVVDLIARVLKGFLINYFLGQAFQEK